MAQIATLREIDSYWSIDDLKDAHDALDAKQDAEEKAAAAIKGK